MLVVVRQACVMFHDYEINANKLYQFFMDSEEALSMKSITEFTKHILRQSNYYGALS